MLLIGEYVMRTFDFSPLFQSTIGFDRFQRVFDESLERSNSVPSYPPYNIEAVDENAYRITMAIAGFSQDDLDVSVEADRLSVSGKIVNDNDNAQYLHRGIATRAFERSFDLADHLTVVGGNLENGVLTIDLEREVPEELKPRKIEIASGPATSLAKKAKKLIGDGEKKAA
jgi:molecular chaperone IbpA